MSDRDMLLEAVKANDAATVTNLLERDSSLAEVRDTQGVSAVLVATYHGAGAARDVLLAHRRELDLFEAAAVGDQRRMAEVLANDTGAAASVSPDGFPAVALAAFFGQIACAALLLEHGADPDAVASNPMRVTAVHAAAAQRDPATALAMTRLLLEHGASVNVAQQGGWTPLHHAAKHGPIELARLLVEHGADVAAANDDGLTALRLAEEAGQTEIAALLRTHAPTA